MEKLFAFRNKLCCPHRPGRRSASSFDGICIDAGWDIRVPACAGTVVRGAADDLRDYFAVSMDVTLQGTGKGVIEYAVDPSLPERTYRIDAVHDKITLTGCSERFAAQAGYALEDIMNLNEYPGIAETAVQKQARFSPRIIHSGIGPGMFPDGHLRMIAHMGFDAVQFAYYPIGDDPEAVERVNDVCRRAADIGLDVYVFACFKNLYHPDDPEAKSYYESTYGRLFENCPGIRGITFVGESCEFPSKDPRSTGKSYKLSRDDERPSPGWFPCDDYPQFIRLVADIIRARRPDTDIVFWTYNWGYVDTELRLALIDKLPKDVTLMSTFEMFEKFEVAPGVQEGCTDYTLWFAGPGTYFDTESRRAGELGLRMYSMTNTGGDTWDIGTVPYLPAPYQWLGRYEAVTDAQDDGALHGLLESHTYGFWPSMMPELAKNAFSFPSEPGEALLEKIVVRDYGAEASDLVLDALADFSEGMTHCIPTNEDQYGPCRIGPSYPLFFERHEPIPIGPESEKDPNWTTLSMYRFHPDNRARLDYETLEYGEMVRVFERGCTALREALPLMPEGKRKLGESLYRVAKFIENTARTTWHVKQWHALKLDLGIFVQVRPIWVGGQRNCDDVGSPDVSLTPCADPVPLLEEMVRIGEAEIANARETIPLVEADSRLGYTQELDYCTSPDQLRWKIEVTRRALDEEVLPRLQALRG